MTVASSRYAGILRDHRIFYVPSCLVVEMMTRLYSQVSTINMSGDIHNIVPDLTTLLRRLTFNLRTTANAYREGRIKFFIGDWRRDKFRARKLLFNIMSRLGYISELLAPIEKKVLYRAIEEMTAEWAAMDEIMENRRIDPASGSSGRSCDYFRSENHDNWRHDMARIILNLDADEFSEYRQPGAYLLLLCYTRIKSILVDVIGELDRMGETARKFAFDKILCVSDEEFPMTCPSCALMSDHFRQGNTEAIHRNYNNTPQRQSISARSRRTGSRKVAESNKAGPQQYRRHLMPPSLVDIQGRG